MQKISLADYQREEVPRRKAITKALVVLRRAARKPGEEPVGPYVQSLTAEHALEILRGVSRD